MSRTPVDVKLGGLSLRVAPFGSPERTQDIVAAVNARLKELEAASPKVNTQAFALQAAYEFACQLAEWQDRLEDEEAQIVGAIAGVAAQVNALRGHIEDAVQSDGQ